MKEDYSDNNLKDILKGKFANEHLAPPKGAWNSIQGQMAKPGRIRKPLYYWLIPVTLIVLVGGGIAINSVFSTKDVQTSSITKTEIENKQEDNSEITSIESKEDVNDNEIQKDEFQNEALENKESDLGKSQEESSVTNIKKPSFIKTKENQTTKKANINQFQNSTTINNSAKTVKNKTQTKENESLNVVVSKTEKEQNKLIENNRNQKLISKSENGEKETSSVLTDKSTQSKLEEKSADSKKLENRTNGPDTKEKEVAVSEVKKETKIINAEPNLKSEPKVESQPDSKNEVSKTQTAKTEDTKVQEKEVVADIKTMESDSIKKSEESLPESNVLLNSKKPRGKLRYDFYLGAGKNPRNSTFSAPSADNTTILLANKKVSMNNKIVGFNMRYQFTPFFSMRSGVGIGDNKFSTNSYSVKLDNSQLGEIIRIATSDGELQSAGLQTQSLTSNGVDSSDYNMSVNHRQGYLSIPISFVVNTKIQPGKMYYYGFSGLEFTARGRGRNKLIIQDGELERSLTLSRLTNVKKMSTNWNIGLGMAFSFQSRLDLFMELNYTRDISKSLNTSLINTNSSYAQVLLGIRF